MPIVFVLLGFTFLLQFLNLLNGSTSNHSFIKKCAAIKFLVGSYAERWIQVAKLSLWWWGCILSINDQELGTACIRLDFLFLGFGSLNRFQNTYLFIGLWPETDCQKGIGSGGWFLNKFLSLVFFVAQMWKLEHTYSFGCSYSNEIWSSFFHHLSLSPLPIYNDIVSWVKSASRVFKLNIFL